MNHYFGFTKNPFSKEIANQEIFFWKSFENLKLRLNYFLAERGIFLLTGAIGSGKTTALKLFASTLNPNINQSYYLSVSLDTKKDFYRSIGIMMGLKPYFFTCDCRNYLRAYLQELYFTKKISPVIILDEAQNLSGFILEEIRLLSNFDFDSYSPALFILSGHKLLQQRIRGLENEALRQRITIQYHIDGMNLEECCAYIRHRMELAGSTHSIFTDSILSKIHEASGGIPRLINKICNSLLLSAISLNKKFVDEIVFEAAKGEWQ